LLQMHFTLRVVSFAVK